MKTAVTPTGIENGVKLPEPQGFRKDSRTKSRRIVGENRSDIDLADNALTARVSTLDVADDLRRMAELIRSGRVDQIDPAERARLAAVADAAAARTSESMLVETGQQRGR
jgi:hypothetical protein